MGRITRRGQGVDLAPLDARLDTLEDPAHSARTSQAEHWLEYKIEVVQYTWTHLQKDGVNLPSLQVPLLPPPRPGHRWEVQVEGFLRVGTTKGGTVYIGIQIGPGMGGVSGGKYFVEGGDDLIPVMQRRSVFGGEEINFSIFSGADGGDTLTIIPNPYPYLLVREVAV